MSLSTEIQRLRASLNLTQKEVAKLWRCSLGSVRAWEQGANQIDPLKLERIQQITEKALKAAKLPPLDFSASPATAPSPGATRKRGRPPKAKPTDPPAASKG